MQYPVAAMMALTAASLPQGAHELKEEQKLSDNWWDTRPSRFGQSAYGEYHPRISQRQRRIRARRQGKFPVRR